jgi:SAM-dependent methyltransferase
MSQGIERGPVYPVIPEDPMPNSSEEESLMAFEGIDEHREMVEENLVHGPSGQFLITPTDIEAKRKSITNAKETRHIQTRSTHEIGISLLATVKQMETEFERQSLLDIGCGEGRFGEAMARNAKAEVTFLDRDEEVLSRISKKAGKLVLADGLDLPFGDESFDKVMSAFSSVHWAETPVESAQALNEAIRVTNVGGSAFIIPLLHNISLRRYSLPEAVGSRGFPDNLHDLQRSIIVWCLQDLVLIRSLFRLADNGYCDLTWRNLAGPSPIEGIIRSRYSVIADKKQPIPAEVLAENIAFAEQFMSAQAPESE